MCSIRDWQHKHQRLRTNLFSAHDRGGVQELGGHRGRESGYREHGYVRRQCRVLVLPRWMFPAHSQRQVLLEHARERREQLVRAAAVRRCAEHTHRRHACPPERVGKWLCEHASSCGTQYLVGSRVLSTQALLGYTRILRYSRTQYSAGTRVLRIQAAIGCSGAARVRTSGTQCSGGTRALRRRSGTQYSGSSRVLSSLAGKQARARRND